MQASAAKGNNPHVLNLSVGEHLRPWGREKGGRETAFPGASAACLCSSALIPPETLPFLALALPFHQRQMPLVAVLQRDPVHPSISRRENTCRQLVTAFLPVFVFPLIFSAYKPRPSSTRGCNSCFVLSLSLRSRSANCAIFSAGSSPDERTI